MEDNKQEILEVGIEDLTHDIKRLNEFLEFTHESRIDDEIKREIAHRLEKEIDWLEQVRDNDVEELNHTDLMVECALEEEKIKRFEEKK